jgi:hypothetical protein
VYNDIKVGKDRHTNENVSKMLLKEGPSLTAMLKKWISEKVHLFKGRLQDNGTAINNS